MPAYNNPYFPAAYPYQQPYYQPVQAAQQPSGIIWVSGDKEASMYPVAPNAAVTLWSQSEPVVYLKQADASGRPAMKIYDLVERTEAVSGDGKAYATREELAAVLASFKREIETMRTGKENAE